MSLVREICDNLPNIYLRRIVYEYACEHLCCVGSCGTQSLFQNCFKNILAIVEFPTFSNKRYHILKDCTQNFYALLQICSKGVIIHSFSQNENGEWCNYALKQWKTSKQDTCYFAAMNNQVIYLPTHPITSFSSCDTPREKQLKVTKTNHRDSLLCCHGGYLYAFRVCVNAKTENFRLDKMRVLRMDRNKQDLARNIIMVERYDICEKSWKEVQRCESEYICNADFSVSWRNNIYIFTLTSMVVFDLVMTSLIAFPWPTEEETSPQCDIRPYGVEFDNKIYLFNVGAHMNVFDPITNLWTKFTLACENSTQHPHFPIIF